MSPTSFISQTFWSKHIPSFLFSHHQSPDQTTIMHLYLLYILSSLLMASESFIFKLFLLITGALVTSLVYHHGHHDLAVCLKITVLFFVTYLESLEFPEIAITGTILLAGIGPICSKNRYVYVFNVLMAILSSYFCLRKIYTFSFYDHQTRSLCRISFLRVIQSAVFFYISMKKETHLNEKLLELTQTNGNINKQLGDIQDFKSTFLSCFSHEVRNPLNALHGSIDVLLKNIKEKSLYPFLQAAKISADVLLKLLNNILDASNLQSDKFEWNCDFYNVRGMVSQLVNMSLESINQKKLTLQIYIDKQIPEEIYTDASRLLQVLLNILSNAIKFSEEGKLVQIYLTWHTQHTSKFELLDIGKDNSFGKRFSRKLSNMFPPSPSGSTASSITTVPTETRQTKSLHRVRNEPSEVLETSFAEWAQRKCINTSKLDVPLKTVSIREINSSCEQIRHKYTIIDTNINSSLQNSEKPAIYRSTRPGYLKIEISDQGCGIAKQDQDIIFDLFAKVDASNSRKYGGIGLGMWVTKKIVEKAGGEIKVYSEEALGTNFVFYLPMESPEESCLHSKSLYDPTPRNRSNKLTALVVDDVKFNRDLLKMMLEAEGVEVYTAENGLEAVRAYRSQPKDFYDLILTDLQMPVMDGVTSSKEIRAIQIEEGRKEVDIYIVSGNCGENDVRECMDPMRGIGAKEFLHKPINAVTLKNIIQQKRKRQC